jgi:hypothetical protein
MHIPIAHTISDLQIYDVGANLLNNSSTFVTQNHWGMCKMQVSAADAGMGMAYDGLVRLQVSVTI